MQVFVELTWPDARRRSAAGSSDTARRWTYRAGRVSDSSSALSAGPVTPNPEPDSPEPQRAPDRNPDPPPFTEPKRPDSPDGPMQLKTTRMH